MKARHLAVLTLIACAPSPGFAADLGGDCCADLEERIAELEATTARKGNRKVSLTVSGHLHSAVMYWDDGREDNIYVVGSANDSIDQTSFQFNGDAQINREWSAGYHITIRVNAAMSGDVSQSDDDAAGDPLTLWEAYGFLESKRLGRIALGQVSRASDGVPETDLSGTRPPAYAGIQSLGGGFALRRSDGALSGLTYGSLYSHLNGDTANLIRYESPSLAGFTFVATYGEDDIWDTAVNYEGYHAGFEFAGALAYSQMRDAGGLAGDDNAPDSEIIVGSAGFLHKPTGLNALIAAGQQSFDQAANDADGQLRMPSDASFIYTKLGLITRLSSLGATSFYGEYGRFTDFSSAGIDADTVASLATAGVCATPGNCRLAGTQSEVWGLGIAQDIDQAAMKIYIGYRYHDTDIDLADTQGNQLAGQQIENLQTVIVGTLIGF